MKAENDLDPDYGEQIIDPPTSKPTEIVMLDSFTRRKLSPMLEERFSFSSCWTNARLSQDWLSLEQISSALATAEIKESFDLRIENWDFVPPATKLRNACAIFAHNPFETDETYLVWTIDGDEPEVWEFYGGDYSRFNNLERYLEYIVGDRRVDDTGRVTEMP